MAKFLIIAGIILIAAGLAWMAGEKFGLGRLPGDIIIDRENFRLYLPLTTSLLISIVLSVALWFLNR